MHTIRPAIPADLPPLHDLIERSYRGESARTGWTHEADLLSGPRTTVAALAEIVADPAQNMLIAIEGTRIVACVQLTDKGGGLAYLGQLAVEPGLQAKGRGREMIAAAENRARGFGATRMEMTVVDRRVSLIAYYERRGYALTGEVRPFPYDVPDDGPPLTLVVMAKPL